MQDPGPFLRGSHKGGYGTVRKGESNQSRQEGRRARNGSGRSPSPSRTKDATRGPVQPEQPQRGDSWTGRPRREEGGARQTTSPSPSAR